MLFRWYDLQMEETSHCTAVGTAFDIRTSNKPAWYGLWICLVAIALNSVLNPRPVISGPVDICIGLSFAFLACGYLILKDRFVFPRETVLSASIVFLFCVAQVLHFTQSLAPPSKLRGFDFSAYYIAAKVESERPLAGLYDLPLFADGRMNLNTGAPADSRWQLEADRDHIPYAAPYIYPPFMAVVMKPFTKLSFHSALNTWNALNVSLCVASLFILFDLTEVKMSLRLAIIVSVGMLSFYPLSADVFFGQIAGVSLFLLAGGLWLLTRRFTLLSATCFAIATMIKLTPLLMVPILIMHRRWRWLVGYLVAVFVLLAYSVWQASWLAHVQFWRNVLPSISSGAPIAQNLSVVAWIQECFLGYVPFGHAPSSQLPAHALAFSRLIPSIIYVLTLLCMFKKRRSQDLVRQLSVMILVMLLVSPISWAHHFNLAIIPLIYLGFSSTRVVKGLLFALFVVSATDIVEIAQIFAKNGVTELFIAGVVPVLLLVIAFTSLDARYERQLGST